MKKNICESVVGLLKSTSPKSDIAWVIKQSLEKLGLYPYDVQVLTSMTVNQIEHIDQPSSTITASELLQCLALLGVELDRVLPLRSLSEEERIYWRTIMLETGSEPIATTNTSSNKNNGAVFGDNVALDLFLQYRAMQELFPCKKIPQTELVEATVLK